MTLADDMRQKASAARQAKAEKHTEFQRKTARLAANRYMHILRLIEGAASEGKDCLLFPSGWHTDVVTTKAVFDEVERKLRADGFVASSKIWQKPPNSCERQIELYISWKEPNDTNEN